MSENLDPWITPAVASRSKAYFAGKLTQQRISQMCRQGVFPSAHKPGSGRNAHWRIRSSELLAHIVNSHVNTVIK